MAGPAGLQNPSLLWARKATRADFLELLKETFWMNLLVL